MTNGEKFKTAEERQSNFNKFCKQHETCHYCPLGHPARVGICRFKWLELEYEEELKPCPFCGGRANLKNNVGNKYFVRCYSCLIETPLQSSYEEAYRRLEQEGEMKVGLIDVDGHNFPNLALMKLSTWHKAQGDEVEFAVPLLRRLKERSLAS